MTQEELMKKRQDDVNRLIKNSQPSQNEQKRTDEINQNKKESETKTEPMNMNKTPNEYSADSGSIFTEGYNLGGSTVMNVGKDIMTGATFQKYTDVKKLEGVQLQYASYSNLKVINFKQDYVVLVRKKLFYAANSESQINKENATKNDGMYVRSYKLDNFTGIRTTTSVSGSPGSCQIDLQGAEFVYCYEENYNNGLGVPPTVENMVSDEFPDNYAQLGNDSNNSMGTFNRSDPTKVQKTPIDTNERQITETNMKVMEEFQKGDIWNRDNAKSFDHPSAKGVTVTMITRRNPDGLTGNVHVKQSNGIEYDLTLPVEGAVQETNRPQEARASGMKIAEKCDWEPMDEVWIFGKSNFERDQETGDFKMNQIFFGYIDTVTKNHSSGKTAGCTITIAATDQLKLLDVSYVSMNPTMTPGASGSQGLDLRFSAQDRKHFGTFELFNPYTVSQMLGAYGSAEDATEEQKEVLNNAWKYLSITNVFAGRPVCEIITQLCKDAGIPTWYLKDRIEPIMFPPFVYQLKNANSSTLFNATMMKRLGECQTAAKKLILEFFADEEGNIVLKAPNYALGVNTLVKNNMGFDQLAGGKLNDIDIDSIQPYYSSNAINYTDSMDNENAKSTEEDSVDKAKDAAKIRRHLTPAAKEYLYQNAMETMAHYNGDKNIYDKDGKPAYTSKEADYTQMSWFMNGATETQSLAEYISRQRTHNPNWNTGSNNTVMYRFKEGDTFASVAQEHLNYSRLAWDVAQQASLQLTGKSNSFDVNECYKCYGKEIYIDLNRTRNDTMDQTERLTARDMYNKITNNGENIDQYNNSNWAVEEYYDEFGNKTGTNQVTQKSQEEYERVAQSGYSDTLSDMTDALIPEIPDSYIMSFSLTDSDKQIYNMYEVNIDGDFGIFDKGGPLIKVSRVFPDLTSMIRFGCRTAPNTVYNFPYMGNKENAHLLGFMLSAMSLARRKSATLSMIEDSFIKVGNPIRFFAYDEHPDEPLSPQGDHANASTALDIHGANGQTNSFQDITNMMNEPFNRSKKEEAIKESETGKEKEIVSDGITQGTGNVDNETPNENLTGQTGTRRPTQEERRKKNRPKQNVRKLNTDDSNYETIPSVSGASLVHKSGVAKGSDYSGARAVDVARGTDAQSVYYVEQISRSIGSSKESTMTLTLSCGRMIGKPSCIDYMLLLYKTYFDPALGYCSDLQTITKYKNKYSGNTHSYKIKPADTKDSIMASQYTDVDFYVPHTITITEEEQVDNTDPYLVENLVKDQTPYPATDDVYKIAQGRGWKRLTSVVTGKIYQIDNPNIPSRGKVLFTYKYYIFDLNKCKWIFVKS